MFCTSVSCNSLHTHRSWNERRCPTTVLWPHLNPMHPNEGTNSRAGRRAWWNVGRCLILRNTLRTLLTHTELCSRGLVRPVATNPTALSISPATLQSPCFTLSTRFVTTYQLWKANTLPLHVFCQLQLLS